MRADQRQPWTISLHAKAKSFNFKFKATNFLPSSKLFQFSLLLKLPPLLIKVKSQPVQVSFPRRQKSLKSKIFRVLEKFRNRPTKNKSISTNFRKFLDCNQPERHSFKGRIGVVISLVVAYLALLFQWVFGNDEKKSMILCLIIISLYIVALSSKKFIARKACILMIVLNVAMVGCSTLLGMGMKNNLSSYVSLFRYVWNWTSSSSSQSLYIPQEFQDILGSIGRFT